MNLNPICHSFPTKKMKCSFLDYVQLLMISQAAQWTQTPSATPLQPKNEMLIFGLYSTSDDWLGWLRDSNPIHHLSQPQKMKCSFLDYVQLLMIGQAGQWTRTPSTTPLHPKTWNACFCITFNIWCWPDWSMDTNPICHPSSAKKMKCFFFGLRSTSDDWPGWSMDSNPICHPSPAKKWNVHFWIMFNFWWLAGLVNGLEKKWNACFWIMFTSDDLPGWLMNLNPICQPSTTKKWNAQFSITFNFWWSTKLINGLKPHLPPLSNQKNEMLLFWITLNFWWLAGLSDGLKPHQPPLSSQKNEMLNFGLHSTFDDWPGWLMDSNPIHHPSPANKMKSSFLYYVELLMINRAGWWTRTSSANPLQPIKWNAHFWILFNFWWSARLVNGPEPHPPRISSQKHEMLIYRFCSTSDDQPGWSMDLNPICHPSSAKKVKCSFLYYNQLLI